MVNFGDGLGELGLVIEAGLVGFFNGACFKGDGLVGAELGEGGQACLDDCPELGIPAEGGAVGAVD